MICDGCQNGEVIRFYDKTKYYCKKCIRYKTIMNKCVGRSIVLYHEIKNGLAIDPEIYLSNIDYFIWLWSLIDQSFELEKVFSKEEITYYQYMNRIIDTIKKYNRKRFV